MFKLGTAITQLFEHLPDKVAEAVVLQLVKLLHVQILSFQHQMKDRVLYLFLFLDPPSWGRLGQEAWTQNLSYY